MSPERKRFKAEIKIQIKKVEISGPAMASVLTMCAAKKSDGFSLWIGKEESTTRSKITDQDADGSETEHSIFLECAVPIAAQNLLNDANHWIPPDSKIIGLLRFRNQTKWFDEPTLFDRKMCRQLLMSDNFKGTTFVFSSVCKVGRSTKVFSFLVDVEESLFFRPVIVRVANLADAPPVIYQEANTSANFSHLIPPPEMDFNSGLVESVFNEFRLLFIESNKTLTEARKTKKRLIEELRLLAIQNAEEDLFADDEVNGAVVSPVEKIETEDEIEDVALSPTI